MVLHLREQVVEENLHELFALEGRFDVKSFCGEHRLSHHVCDLVSGTENGHNHNHLHILCDSLFGHSIFVCTLFLGLGLGKDQIYLDYDSDMADSYFRELSEMYVLAKIERLHLRCNAGSQSVSGHLVSCSVQLLGVRLYHTSEIFRLSTIEGERYQRKNFVTFLKVTHMRSGTSKIFLFWITILGR